MERLCKVIWCKAPGTREKNTVCFKHYQRYRNTGTYEPARHFLTDIDVNAAQAFCEKCKSLVPIHTGRIACKFSKSEQGRKNNYGFTGYVQMFNKQNGKCAICGVNTKLVVDHDHETGEIRGLLCSKCNLGIGHFRESSDILESARSYLAKGGVNYD